MLTPKFSLLPTLVLAGWGACQSDDISNLRPVNISGLAYFFYEWTGSYYNGTTTITIKPQDYDKETGCDTFTHGEDVEVVYENSIFAIVEPNRYYDDPHDFEWSLTYWDKSVNVTPTHPGSGGNSPVNDVEQIQSLYELDSYSDKNESPDWSYNATLNSGVSYDFSGYLNNSKDAVHALNVAFNYSFCSSEDILAEWGGAIIGPDDVDREPFDNLRGVHFPTISGSFDDETAFVEISGIFVGWAPGPDDDSTLGGAMSIVFEGKIDRDRSDEMTPSGNDTPRWNHTLGYSKVLFDENLAGRAVYVLSSWVYGLGFLGVLMWVL